MIVDGGYLSFKLAFGSYALWEYEHIMDISLFALDSWNIRNKDFETYKDIRSEQPSQVTELRQKINASTTLPTCKIEGLEADDLVCCWWLFNQEAIVGIDKDYFVLPELNEIYYHNLQPYTRKGYISKLSGIAKPVAEENFALYQVLFGDSIDRIPRLLARGNEGKRQLQQIMNGDVGEELPRLFGEDAMTNLKSVLFPHYSKINEGVDWYQKWCDGTYWDKRNWTSLFEVITSKKAVTKARPWMELF